MVYKEKLDQMLEEEKDKINKNVVKSIHIDECSSLQKMFEYSFNSKSKKGSNKLSFKSAMVDEKPQNYSRRQFTWEQTSSVDSGSTPSRSLSSNLYTSKSSELHSVKKGKNENEGNK